MFDEYDFSNAKKNPYTKQLRNQVTLSVPIDVLRYFESISVQTGRSCQSLMQAWLAECKEYKPNVGSWKI